MEVPPPEDLSAVHEQLWQTVLQFGNLSAVKERNRIARDLHDSLGQSLTALNIQLQTAVKLWQLDPTRAEEFLAEAQRLGSVAVSEVRQTVKTLRTEGAEDQSLETLIQCLVKDFERSTNITPTTEIALSDPLPVELITPLYRIVQEALNNVCKYAEATEVQIQLCSTPSTLRLIIRDNGRGFDPNQARSGFGLQGMQERVALLRGNFQLESAPGAGCQIQIEIPMKLVLPKQPELVDAPQVTVTRPIGVPRQTELAPVTQRSTEAAIATQPTHLELSSEQSAQIEKILLALVGPIAPVLLQQTVAEVEDYSELVECLSRRVTAQSRSDFEQQMNALGGTITKVSVAPTFEPPDQPPDATEIDRCQQALTDVIGPIAPLLVQQVLNVSPNIGFVEFVETLEQKISNTVKRARFKRQVFDRSP